MNRSDGLVQRRNVIRDNGCNSSKDNNVTDNKTLEDEVEEGVSKEPRLTLMEEVLLLGLKDKEVSQCITNRLYVCY